MSRPVTRLPVTRRRGARSRTTVRRRAVLLLVMLASLVLSGCDFDVYKLPLPGGADVGSDPIVIKADFRDVLDLVPKSTVKVNDVTVGEITDITLKGYQAVVTMKLRNDTELPDNTVATIRQTSLLGEKFVSLAPPDVDPTGKLKTGDVIDLDHTGRNPEVEEVLGALSLVLNGGGVAQAQTIFQEVNKALDGHESATRSLLTQVQTLTTTLDDNKDDIVGAIDALNNLSLAVQKQQGNIDKALDELPSALTSINSQRTALVKMLKALDDLSDVGVRVINASKTATIDTLTQLQPVLTQLADSGDAFVGAFSTFLTFPFVDEVVGRDPQVARNLQVGDYTNLSIQLQLDLSKVLTLPTTLPTNLPSQLIGAVTDCINHVVTAGLPGLQDTVCTSLVGTTVLQDYCAENTDQTQFCALVGLIPGLPTLPGAFQANNRGFLGGLDPFSSPTSSASPTSRPTRLPTSLPTGLPTKVPTKLPTLLPTKLPTLLPTSLPTLLPTSSSGGGLLGGLLGRTIPFGSKGPTMGQLEILFDPSLVSIMVPPLVAGTTSSTDTTSPASTGDTATAGTAGTKTARTAKGGRQR